MQCLVQARIQQLLYQSFRQRPRRFRVSICDPHFYLRSAFSATRCSYLEPHDCHGLARSQPKHKPNQPANDSQCSSETN